MPANVSFNIGNLGIGTGRTFIIAEAGQNHQGDISIAKKMILAAKAIGADCVKFQKSFLPEKFTKSALSRAYDVPNSFGRTYGEHKEFLEFSLQQYRELQAYAKEVGIQLTASAMDIQALQDLYELEVPFVKIGSGDTNNFEMLNAAIRHPTPLIISTGMQCEYMLDCIKDLIIRYEKQNIGLLHCVSAYPTEPRDASLRMITYLRQKFPTVVIGYSGHERGTAISMAAVLLGARVIERHFTLDRTQKGTDHKLSLEPAEFKQLIRQIRRIESSIPDIDYFSDDEILQRLSQHTSESGLDEIKLALKPVTGKTILDCEIPCQQKLGKSLVFKRYLEAGSNIQATDMCAKVTEPFGLSAERLYEFVGCELAENVNADDSVIESKLCPRSEV